MKLYDELIKPGVDYELNACTLAHQSQQRKTARILEHLMQPWNLISDLDGSKNPMSTFSPLMHSLTEVDVHWMRAMTYPLLPCGQTTRIGHRILFGVAAEQWKRKTCELLMKRSVFKM